jgi:hypothetical protein
LDTHRGFDKLLCGMGQKTEVERWGGVIRIVLLSLPVLLEVSVKHLPLEWRKRVAV